ALIRCPDCGHQVSDLAPACPQCARPVGTFPVPEVAHAPVAAKPQESVRPSVLDAGMLAREKQIQVTGKTDGVSKVCVECGEDVTHDMFRTKSDDGYLCAECQDEELDRAWHARQRLQNWVKAFFLIFVVGTLLFGAMAAVTTLSQQKGATTKKK
ncbi:MAG TPA: hypothetical protein VF316_13125, partial [Polyangiaceae bacterium]